MNHYNNISVPMYNTCVLLYMYILRHKNIIKACISTNITQPADC